MAASRQRNSQRVISLGRIGLGLRTRRLGHWISLVQILSKQLQEIQRRYGVPSDQFDRRIKDISAIAVEPHTAHSVSLYQLVHAEPIARLPAYEALIEQIRKEAGETGPSEARIFPVAQQASEKQAARLITSGGAGVTAAVVSAAYQA